MGAGIRMTLAVEIAWIALEAASMSLVALTYAVHARRLRDCQNAPRPTGALAPVICIDRH